MWDDVLRAFALLFVIEGMLPFLAPQLWRRLMVEVMGMDDRSLRWGGLAVMVFGVVLLYVVR
jgi:uncharacterized protein YjeT (DUF2065 family)